MTLRELYKQLKDSDLDTEIGKGSLVDDKWEFDSDILIRFCSPRDFVNTSDRIFKGIIVIF